MEIMHSGPRAPDRRQSPGPPSRSEILLDGARDVEAPNQVHAAIFISATSAYAWKAWARERNFRQSSRLENGPETRLTFFSIAYQPSSHGEVRVKGQFSRASETPVAVSVSKV
jgi:membrane protein implicated in regulation of membrane protease activity